MINATQIRVGHFLKLDGQLYSVLKVHHVTPGKGNAVVQTDLRNLRTGIKINNRFRSTETVEDIELSGSKMNFLYQEGSNYHLMDPETYEQLELSADILGDLAKHLKPELPVTLFRYEGRIVSVNLPPRIVYTVTTCDPPSKGFAGATKSATLENGNVVKVPLFIKEGDTVLINIEDNEYLEKG